MSLENLHCPTFERKIIGAILAKMVKFTPKFSTFLNFQSLWFADIAYCDAQYWYFLFLAKIWPPVGQNWAQKLDFADFLSF